MSPMHRALPMPPWPAILLAALLVGCATDPPTHYHSLLPAAGQAGTTTTLPVRADHELLPVSVPAQVDQPQWLVRLPDDTLALLEYERWAGPLAEEIRAALADRLRAAGGGAGNGHWRIAVEVQRFDSVYARHAGLEAEWSLRRTDAAEPTLRCRSAFFRPAAAGYVALAAAHRQAVAALGDAIASALSALRRGAVPRCDPAAG